MRQPDHKRLHTHARFFCSFLHRMPQIDYRRNGQSQNMQKMTIKRIEITHKKSKHPKLQKITQVGLISPQNDGILTAEHC